MELWLDHRGRIGHGTGAGLQTPRIVYDHPCYAGPAVGACNLSSDHAPTRGVPASEGLYTGTFHPGRSLVLELLVKNILNNQISSDEHMTDDKQYSSTGSATT